MSSQTTAIVVPAISWQPDDAVLSCPLCQANFTWFHRKHHCRKCGRVVCNNCCSKFYSLPSASIVRQPESELPTFFARLAAAEPGITNVQATGVEEVRTCDSCFSAMEQDRCRRMLGLDISTLDPRSAAQIIRDSFTAPSLLASPPPSYSRASNIAVTNVEGQIVRGDESRARRGNGEGQVGSHGHRNSRRSHRPTVTHTSMSLPARPNPSLPSPLTDVVPLRYVSFELNDHDKMIGDECPICFEEYEPYQKIARLECWCVFHVNCIKAWKSQKAGTRGCPLHFHD